jgi:hypothetical protein
MSILLLVSWVAMIIISYKGALVVLEKTNLL